jgi:hypothetical protein
MALWRGKYPLVQVDTLGVKFAQEVSRSIRDRPRRSTDQAATMSTPRATA